MAVEQMTDLLHEYADVIASKLLKLTEGTLLSVNTEECDFDFARIVANTALKYTKTTVKIVQTVNGRPSDVIDFDPEGLAVKPNGYAMLRIAHVYPQLDTSEKTLDIIVDKNDLKTVQKLGHLAQPVVLNRRIAVPWASVKVFNPSDLRWNDIKELTGGNIENACLVADYRKKFLSHSDVHEMVISGDNFQLKVCIPEDTLFVGGSTKLSNGKTFISGFDFETLNVNSDCNSAEGTLKGKAVIFGKPQIIELTLKDGLIVSHSNSPELSRLLEFDQNLRKIGYLSMADRKFSVHFGGALLDCFENEPETEDDIPAYFNQSLYTFEVELDEKLNISFSDCSGKVTELVRKGFFLE